jgi:hypothetical protein
MPRRDRPLVHPDNSTERSVTPALLVLFLRSGCHADESKAIEVHGNTAAGARGADGISLFCGGWVNEDGGSVADRFSDGLPELVAYAGRDRSYEDSRHDLAGAPAQGPTQVVGHGCRGDHQHRLRRS